MTVPNLITFFRFLLAGVFAYLMILFSNTESLEYRYWALGAFILAAVSDFADGYIARKYRSTSTWGAIMDPIADKLLTLIVLFFLAWIPSLRERLYPWLFYLFALLVVVREILILGGISLLKLMNRQVTISPSKSGKWCTAIQFTTLAALILGIGAYGNILIAVSSLFVLYSGAGYVYAGWQILKEKNSPRL